MSLKALTANRLIDGVAVWLAEGDKWTERATNARVERDAEGHAALEAAGARETRACVVVDAALVDVEFTDKGPLPTKLKERIRALGPTVRTDLGKQAESQSHLERVA